METSLQTLLPSRYLYYDHSLYDFHPYLFEHSILPRAITIQHNYYFVSNHIHLSYMSSDIERGIVTISPLIDKPIPLTSLNLYQDSKEYQQPIENRFTVKRICTFIYLLLTIIVVIFLLVKITLVLVGSPEPSVQSVDKVLSVLDTINKGVLILQPTSSNSKPIIIHINRTNPDTDSLEELLNKLKNEHNT